LALIERPHFMSFMLRNSKWIALAGLVWMAPWLAPAQSLFSPQGGEYAVVGSLPGDQVHPQLAVTRSGGFVAWQDNATDGDGLGISAQRLNENLSATLGAFRINTIGAGDQENPQVALLPSGGAVFVWQGGAPGYQKVYARFMTVSNTFATPDVQANSYTNNQQINPAAAALSDGNVVVVWSSIGQDGSMQGIFAQRFSATGAKLGGEFQINQFSAYNQRSPAIAALPNGKFVVVWISEQQRFENSVDVYARLGDSAGQFLGGEFRINSGTSTCANPAVAAGADGGFGVVWAQNSGRVMAPAEPVVVSAQDRFFSQVALRTASATNGWDIMARMFDSSGAPVSADLGVNAHTYGDQFAPKISARGSDYLLVWTSMGQDGSWESVFGRFLTGSGSFSGSEFQINSTTISRQLYPAVAADGQARFLVAWSSFVGGVSSFDLFAQRYGLDTSAQPPPKTAAPFVGALSQSRLSVTWPELAGFQVSGYELFIDDRATPVTVTSNYFVLGQLPPGSTHTFRLKYKLADGRVSPLSEAASGVTWSEDENGDGLPDDWESLYWGPKADKWPGAAADSDNDGASNFHEFLAGTNPIDPRSVLRTEITFSSQGWRLNWNTQPGFIYQVQITADLAAWTNLGTLRFANGTIDSIQISGSTGAAFYRVIRLR
jgi:hypothetical protein